MSMFILKSPCLLFNYSGTVRLGKKYYGVRKYYWEQLFFSENEIGSLALATTACKQEVKFFVFIYKWIIS